MGISKKIEMIVKDNYTLQMIGSLNFYKNDALKLIFKINEYNFTLQNNKRIRTTAPIIPKIAKLLIETPLGVDFTEPTNITNNEISFFVDSKFTQHTGITRMQIILKDGDGCRVTLPEFTMEIREPIADEKASTGQAICGEFLCGDAICGDTGKVKQVTQYKTIEIQKSLSEQFYEKFGGEF